MSEGQVVHPSQSPAQDSQTAVAHVPRPGQTFALEVQLLSAASYQATHRTSWGAELVILFSLLLALHEDGSAHHEKDWYL